MTRALRSTFDNPASIDAATAVPLAGRAFLRLAQGLPHGQLRLRLPDGQVLSAGAPHDGPSGELHLRDWRACAKIMRSGDIGFAEAFAAGWVHSPDLTALLHLALANERAIERLIHGSPLARLWHHLLHRLRANTRRGSVRNIHAHYDIGNAFYRLWLDDTWTYSAACFDGDAARSLADAQAAKYQRIIDTLGLRAGDQVLEIGCGWGGFAEHAARLGIRVHGVTISSAQLEHARQRIEKAGLSECAHLAFRDYRDLPSLGLQADAIVSIEMFEAVGEAQWGAYFDVVRRCLRPGGKALIQTITIDERLFERYRAGSDFIQQMVFPGGMLPSVERFERAAAVHGLAMTDIHRFGRDYAETLRRWRSAFDQHRAALPALGLDEAFARTWQLYLCYCEAGFDHGRIDVAQIRLQS